VAEDNRCKPVNVRLISIVIEEILGVRTLEV
jgi:hypothetical protein